MDNQLVFHASENLSTEDITHHLSEGPGALIIRGAYSDNKLLDAIESVFYSRIAEEGEQTKDHFSKGTNKRLWNALNKLAEDAPELFAEYYGNQYLHLGCQAWLGPLYQITAQVNVVMPNGPPQIGHRDYHLGYFPPDIIRQMPKAIYSVSPWLTLQGAVVHCDVPIEMGPTKLLLGSQKDKLGYLTYRDDEEQNRFAREAIQVEFKKGDLVLFNPAIFHAAGGNSTDSPRMVNLLQVSSALAKPMEHLDFCELVKQVYPMLINLNDEGLVERTIKTLVDAYPFPSNLDLDPPSEDWLGELDSSWLLDEWKARRDPKSVMTDFQERLAKRRYRNSKKAQKLHGS